MIDWSRDAVKLIKQLHEQNPALYDASALPLQHHGHGRSPTAALDLYHGGCAPRTPTARSCSTTWTTRRYDKLITEEVKPWSYMKFPYLTELGPDDGWYRSARWRACRTATHPHPLAELERKELMAYAAAAVG
jgi:NAD-reducing hydrogenase large subunit